MLLLVLTIILSVLSGLLYWNHRRKYRFADKWPTMQPAYPLVGNALSMVGKTDVERFEVIKRAFRVSDRISKAWAGPKLLLITSHPDLIQQILTSQDCLEKPFLYEYAGFSEGLFTAKYPIWKGTRKRLNPCFNQRVVNSFVPVFVRCAEKMVASLNECEDGATVSMHKYTSLCTVEMACGTTIGTDILDRKGKREFKQALDIASERASRRMISVHLYPDFVYRFTRFYKECTEARKIVVDYYTQLVMERKELLLKKATNNNNGNEEEDITRPKILVDQLLTTTNEDGKPYSDKQITDNVYATMTGATDTAGLLTAYSCLFMSFYPEVQERLYAEIIEHFPADSAELDFDPETIKELKYTEMFLNEVQRHWTAVPQIARQNIAEVEIDGVKVPPGTIFVMSLIELHKRKDVWGPDAERFDPENFSPERVKDRHPFGYLPFSGGNRICIGWRYAMFAMKIIMVHLVRNFKFSSKIKPEDIVFKHDLTLKLPFDVMVQVTKRNVVKYRKLRVVVTDLKQANDIASNEIFTREYRVYVPSRMVEIDGVVREESLTVEDLMKDGIGRFKNVDLQPVKILECKQLHSKSAQDGKYYPSDSFHKLWRVTRKRLNPCFNQRILNGFIPTFVKCARHMTEKLNRCLDGATVNIHRYTSICTLEMACGTSLGSDIAQYKGKIEFVHGLDVAFNEAARRMACVHLYPDTIYRHTSHYRDLMQARNVVCDFFKQIVTEKKKQNSSKGDCEKDDNHKPKPLIDQLLSSSQDGMAFSETEIIDNIYAVITGANDTSGLLIAHACLFLCFYKDIQEKLYAEIMELVPNDEVEINADTLKKLTYLEMFLKECLRHCPVAPNISRENMVEMEIDGMKVPPGNIFIMNFYALHRRKDVWGPDAERFDPEQFSEQRAKDRHPFSFLPFSGGSRMCIGWRYAMISMKVMLIYLIRNFRFDSKIRQEDVRYRHDLTMKLPFEHLIQINKRFHLKGSSLTVSD
ncbi:cytochrome P450 4C1-like [Malaya genurostris]|uniref:cytochrome P450 4C1-like n=1 Tax=Malaya genurostris TaxID=325434 RepID=UPI0026F39679|nr:cytochrome P450 4C1-like [Malaya genurostris]